VIKKRIQESLSDERKFQLLVDSVTDYAIYMLTPDGHVNSWNSGAERIKGYRADEILGAHFSRFYTEEDRARGEPGRALAIASREGRMKMEGWRLRKDGTRFWASVVIDAIKDDDGTFVGFAKVTRDITERKNAEEALRESEQHFRLLVQGVADYAIYMLSPEGHVTNWNAGAQRIKGYSDKEILGAHFSRFYTEEDIAAGEPQRALAIAEQEGKYEREGWRVRRDGSRFFAHVLISSIRDDDGNLVGFATVTRDITERQKASELLEQARARLFQSQKLEAVGKLTGGVAHDFNNVLQIIGGNLQLLRPRISTDAQATKHLENAIEGVERGAKISSQLLAFARRQPLQPVVVNLARLVRGMDDLLRGALGGSIQIETVVAGGLWNTMVDPHQLENVILNVALNARDAMKDGGKLTIEIGNSMLDDQYTLFEPDVPAGQYVMLAISDTGTGMASDVMEQAFEPFFTTKPEGEGTGLGLSMAHGLVKQSGGHIKIYSEVGHGTTIKIYLPRSFQAEAELPVRLKGPVIGGTETILMVEDDPKVQATVVDMLVDLGYQVLKANDGQSALSVIRSGVNIDLLFTDVVMPGPIRSPDLAKQAKQYFPDVEILFTSGYTQNAIVHGGRLDPGVELLSKPYRREDLARKVRQMFANRQDAARAKQNSPGAAGHGAAASEAPVSLNILVVEDNADLREMVCEMLRLLGHKAQGAGTYAEAVPCLHRESFDVLLTDITLPGMSGLDLAEEALRHAPNLKVILASGYVAVTELEVNFPAIMLPKPYDLVQLQAALNEVVAHQKQLP
jgi:PAS domain S-box-containing protein